MFETTPSASSPVLVKICGVTTVADAVECARAGADAIGLNFHPPSPRRVEPSVAAEIVAALPATCTPVGLFVDRPPGEVADACARAGLRCVQLHGDEPPGHLVELGHLRLIRAFRLGDAGAVDRMLDYLRAVEALGRAPDAVLVDAYVTGQPGGTGHAIVQDVLDLLAPLSLPRLILAGGLNPGNVAGRVARVRPWMVDVASGVESSPGRKHPRMVAEFIASAKA